MRDPIEREVKKDVVFQKCFECLTQKGIENITTKDFSEATGMATSSLYYWFKDKDEIVLDAVEWGLNANIKNLFDFAFEHTENLKNLCKGLIVISKDNKYELRLIFQIATSPQYGEYLRSLAGKLEVVYQKYTKVLAEKLNMDFDKVFPYVNLFIAAIVEAVMWDNWDKLDMEMNFIVDSILKAEQKANLGGRAK